MSEQMQFAEIQGLYGPVTFSERLIQRIWLRGDYQQGGLQTLSGKPLRIHHPGRWNLQEGPDFLGADLELAGQRLHGDVEIHFYEKDWQAHGHQRQPRFNNVILHVVVFPPRPETDVQTARGTKPESLCLLPYLNEDLEAYAAEEAIQAWEGRDAATLLEGFLCLSPDEREKRLLDNARKRFLQKVQFCRKRLEKAPWERVFHSLTLEVLGYRRNRAPMYAIAQAHPPTDFLRATTESLFASQTGQWKLAGLRPANHPRLRLEQYRRLLQNRADWQARLQAWACSLRLREGGFSTDTQSYRKLKRLASQRRELANNILAGSIGGTRLDTWMADAALPLLSRDDPMVWFPIWFHWYEGDMPEAVNTVLKQSGLPTSPQPRCNGWAQGTWQLFLESGL